MQKKLQFYNFFLALCFISLTQQVLNQQSPTCTSRVISLIPKTMKYHYEFNNTKQLKCKSGTFPNFVSLDQRCYLIVFPQSTGDFQVTINAIISQTLMDGSQVSNETTLAYVLSIQKIRYNVLNQQQVQYDISLNRVINIQPQSTQWFLKPGQHFETKFSVYQTSKIYEKIFFDFINLPSGLAGDQINGIVKGTIDVPGYYTFGVRVFDLQGNSQTLDITLLVYDQNQIFKQDDYVDENILKEKVKEVQNQISQASNQIKTSKTNIQKYLQFISTTRQLTSDLKIQQRKLQGSQKSLAYAADWSKGNLQIMKKKYELAQQTYNNKLGQTNDGKRVYQTSLFSIKQKESQIQKQQIEGDRRFQMYISADKNYSLIRINLDECERKNKKIADDVMTNLKDLDKANFVQNLQNIIQSN